MHVPAYNEMRCPRTGGCPVSPDAQRRRNAIRQEFSVLYVLWEVNVRKNVT